MERKIKGSLDVNVDPRGMEARLTFTPQEDGPEWGPEEVGAFLEKKRVTSGYTLASIDTIFPKLMKLPPGSPAVEEIVATGTPAEKASEEIIDWQEWPVPEKLKEDAEIFFAKAPSPELYVVKIEKIQKKKKVLEKKMPFGRGKEKEVTVTESREIKEPVAIDPRVEATGWINAGDLIAEITPSEPGKEGKDVYGRAVPSEKDDSDFVCGKGVERKENTVTALESGFIRRGKNWAEVLVFEPHNWELELSRDQNTVLLTFSPGDDNAYPPNPETVLKEAADMGVAEDTLISAFELGNILQNSLEQKKPVSKMPISSDEDGFFEILVSADKLTAVLNMKKSRGRGKPLVLKEFGKALKEKQFKNVDYTKVQEDILDFYRGKDRVIEGYVLAEGEKPSDPGERKVEFTLNYLKPEEITSVKQSVEAALKINPDLLSGIESIDKFPADSADKMAMVTSGMVIAEIEQEPGQPGRDVFGNKVEFNQISDTGFRFLSGIERQGNKIHTTAEGLLEQWDREEFTAFRIRPHKNGLAEIKTAPNRMSSSITLHPPIGTGKLFNIQDIKKLIQEKGIVYGVNEDILQRAVENANKGEEIRDLVFANGKNPVNGEEAKLEFLVALSKDRGVTIKADGRADYRNQDHITMVKKGETIARLIKSNIQAEDGVDVTGGSIPSRDVPQDTLETGDNIEKKEGENELLFVASAGGELLYENNRIAVMSVHVVKGNVGKESGNIKFSGTVKIGGYVQSGYVVMSQEDIFVKDNVEASLLSAGGEIVIEKGIVGGGKAILRARKTIKATFAEQCTLLAIEGVYMKKSCMQCSVKTNGKLNVVADKGAVLGGKIQARDGMDIFNLGSEKQIKTSVSFGQDYLVYDQIELEEKEIEKVKNAIPRVDLKLKKAEKEKKPELISKMRAEKLKLMKLIEKRSMRVLMLRERFEEHHPSELKVRGTVFPGVVLESHGRTMDIREPKTNVTFYFDLETGHIKMKNNKENS